MSLKAQNCENSKILEFISRSILVNLVALESHGICHIFHWAEISYHFCYRHHSDRGTSRNPQRLPGYHLP